MLGPLLFLIYINDIDDIPLSPGTKLVIYADDVLLYKPIQSAVNYVLLQKNVDAVVRWSTINYLKFNPTKCKAVVFSRKRSTTAPCDPLALNGQALDLVDSVKYLGLTICSDLSWSEHINTTSKARCLVGLLFCFTLVRQLYFAQTLSYNKNKRH